MLNIYNSTSLLVPQRYLFSECLLRFLSKKAVYIWIWANQYLRLHCNISFQIFLDEEIDRLLGKT